VIFQTKEPLSQHKSENIPPINSDDEDLVDEDSTENSDFVHHMHPYAFSYSSIRLLIPGEDADLTSGYLNIHQTPPDLTV
jgi:hypothetical protein